MITHRRDPLRLALALLLGATVALSPLLLPAHPAQAAATFTVNATADRGDERPGDGACSTGVRILFDNGGILLECTLRAAIEEANVTPGADLIRFHIPGTGVQTISPATGLPSITETLTIDGTTQPGSSVNTVAVGTNAVPRIELDGTNVGGDPSGLLITAPNTLVRGLVINRFETGIEVRATSGVRIVGCFLGTDATGFVIRGNNAGLSIRDAANTVIGGTAPADRNLISGNHVVGIDLRGPGSLVQGNLIGTTKSGVNELRNVTGVSASASNTVIGGTTAGAANTIAYNGLGGVVVTSGTGTRILRNSIFANGGIGIDLEGGFEAANGNGATSNDFQDGDTGPNTLQNKPRFVRSPVTDDVSTRIEARLNSTPNQSFVVRFFANPPGGAQGKTFLGQLSGTTNAQGNVSFRFVPLQRVAVGQTITVTATNAGGNTSEFSSPQAVVSSAVTR